MPSGVETRGRDGDQSVRRPYSGQRCRGTSGARRRGRIVASSPLSSPARSVRFSIRLATWPTRCTCCAACTAAHPEPRRRSLIRMRRTGRPVTGLPAPPKGSSASAFSSSASPRPSARPPARLALPRPKLRLNAQRNALEILANSERRGCALGAAAALVGDWWPIRRLLDRAASRAGLDSPAPRLAGRRVHRRRHRSSIRYASKRASARLRRRAASAPAPRPVRPARSTLRSTRDY